MTEKRKGLSWGVGIWLLYGGFVLFTLAIVAYASLQDFDLVESDYYEKGVAYQTQIDRLERTRALVDQPRVVVNGSARTLTLLFPKQFDAAKVSGGVSLYRPSNSAYDRTDAIRLTADREQIVSMADLPPGLWKVKLDWQYDGVSYYNEEVIVLE